MIRIILTPESMERMRPDRNEGRWKVRPMTNRSYQRLQLFLVHKDFDFSPTNYALGVEAWKDQCKKNETSALPIVEVNTDLCPYCGSTKQQTTSDPIPVLVDTTHDIEWLVMCLACHKEFVSQYKFQKNVPISESSVFSE